MSHAAPSARRRAALAGVALLLAGAGAPAADVQVRSGGAYSLPITSLKAARYRTTVPQQYDFSCGSAATATLLTFQYGEPVSEADVFRRMYEQGDQARIRTQGFSLRDMQRYLAGLGFEADGFQVPLDLLAEESIPAIVLLNDRGYRHFVVVKGLRDGRVLLGDPARGTRAMARSRFEKLWDNQVVFVIHNRRQSARFNHPDDWRTAPIAPLRLGIPRDDLRNIVMPRRGPGDT